MTFLHHTYDWHCGHQRTHHAANGSVNLKVFDSGRETAHGDLDVRVAGVAKKAIE